MGREVNGSQEKKLEMGEKISDKQNIQKINLWLLPLLN